MSMKFIFCALLLSSLALTYGSVLPSVVLGLPVPTNPVFTINDEVLTPNSAPLWPNYTPPFDIPCLLYITDDVVAGFRVNIYKFITSTFRKIAVQTEGHFVFSPLTAWLSIAAIAEGIQGNPRKELLKALSLPEDRCVRQIYYKLATTREFPSSDVILARNRLFVADSSLRVNRQWKYFAKLHTNLNTLSIPFKTNSSAEIDNLKRVFKAQLPNINLSGNSFLLESLDYHGLWSSAFSNAIISTGPFFDGLGEEVGTLEYMKMNKRVNIAYATSANLNAMQIPVGRDNRYQMFFAMTPTSDQTMALEGFHDDLVFEVLANLKLSDEPIEIMIPRLTMTGETDLRPILEEIGVKSLWTDEAATRNISTPAALPSSFIQRVTVSLDNSVVRPPVPELQQSPPTNPYHEDSFQSFIANRPFMFGIYDVETYTLLFAAVVSKPI